MHMLTNLLNYLLMEERSYNMVVSVTHIYLLLMVITYVRFVQHWVTHGRECIWTEPMTKVMSGSTVF